MLKLLQGDKVEHLIYGIITFFIIYILYLQLLILRKDKVDKIYKSTEAIILKKRYKVKIEKIKAKTLANIVGITNAFIVAIVIEIISAFTNKLLLQMIIGFVLLIVLIFIFYSLLALFLRKKYE